MEPFLDSQTVIEKNQEFQFDGKRLITPILRANSIIFGIVMVQYLLFPAAAGILMHDYNLLGSILFIYCMCALIGAQYYQSLPISLMNSLLLFVGFGIFGYISLYFNGIFNIPLFLIVLPMTILNFCGFCINIRSQMKSYIGNAVIMTIFYLATIAFVILLHTSLMDYIGLIFPSILYVFGIYPIIIKVVNSIRFYKEQNKPVTLKQLFNHNLFHHVDWKKNGKQILVGSLIIGSIFGTLLIGSYNNWGTTFRIKAADDYQTISSYWGPPSLTLKQCNSKISVINNQTLQISNDTLELDPDRFIPGTLAYITNLTVNGTMGNYCNYSAGAQSYPNGTVFLNTPLNSTENVNITFKYVFNNKVLQDLNTSRSTLVMNYHGDFIYHDNIFERITTVYLLQLLDFWEIKFYLDISNGKDFPHVFNYLDSIPLGYQTLNWADGKWTMFQGISYDFEGGEYQRAGQNPGTPVYPIGELIGNETPAVKSFQKSWYNLNEQNYTLFKNVTAEYEELYAYGSSLGYKTYITTGLGEIREKIDNDVDTTRCPVDPISPNKDVLYGHMLYQDNNFKTGRYQVYKGIKDQIALLGDQGKTILLGWIANGTRYYTDDEIGFQRYVKDCKIAQAAGIEEIFHAPIYRMQGKWGDDAILRLHQALNEDPKEEIEIEVPSGLIERGFLEDVIKNLNRLWIAIPLWLIIPSLIVFQFRKK